MHVAGEARPARLANMSTEEVVLLVISSPPTAGDRTNLGSLS
ncbi:hypothetical protein [Burkholderia sp. F1]